MTTSPTIEDVLALARRLSRRDQFRLIAKIAQDLADETPNQSEVLLAPDVAQAFPTAESVNEALRLVIRLSEIHRRAAS